MGGYFLGETKLRLGTCSASLPCAASPLILASNLMWSIHMQDRMSKRKVQRFQAGVEL